MKTQSKFLIISLGLALFFGISCKREVVFNSDNLAPMDTTGSLKASSDFPVGIGINANLMLNNSTYASIVRNQFDNVSFEYSMKQAPIVGDDGSFNYSNADNLLNFSQEAGVKVFGHTLIWHKNNNGNYLRSLVSGGSGSSAPNLILNGGFEQGSGGTFDNWSVYNNQDATIETATGESNVHSGSQALKIINTADHDGGQWKVQIGSDAVPTEVGKDYKVSFWIKAENDGGSGRLSTQPTAQYQGDFNTATTWIPITWEFTAKDPNTNILFDMGLKANTYYIDDVQVTEVGYNEPAAPQNLVMNPSFESGTGDTFDNWSVLNNNDATVTETTLGSQVHDGSRAMQVDVTADHDGSQWKVQIATDAFPTQIDSTYKITFWVKSLTDGGSGRLSTNPGESTAQYQGDWNTTTSWSMVTWTITANSAETSISFDMGAKANTYFIDEVSAKLVPTGNTGGSSMTQDSTAIANFMDKYIKSTVSHFKGEVTGWDVVNEPLQDGTGDIRTDLTPETPTEGDEFYWAKFLGKSYIANAFRIADSVDADVPLYINEYNLESDPAKLDAMVKLVNELKAQNVPIDGIGTQMHINLNTSYAGIDDAFQKLASTGLKVRVSELDVRINPDNNSSFEPTPQMLSYQQIMYNYVVWSYMQNVPADQRAGITVWNLTDESSWIVRGGKKDYPTLYNKDYEKKPAYSGFLQGLKGLKPNESN